MTAENEFVLSHVFNGVSTMMVNGFHFSPVEKRFGVPWKIGVQRNTDHLGVYLHCLHEKSGKEWSIEVSKEGKIRGRNGKTHSYTNEVSFESTQRYNNWGWYQFISWEKMMKHYVVDDTLKVDIRVKIKRMAGIPKMNLMSFDESNRKFSDVVLVVEDQKFYVSKLFLANQSPFFQYNLLKLSAVPEYPEHTLQNVKAPDFQNFLELLYGEFPIDEYTIEGITHLANMYDAKLAIRKCERFLIENSEKSLQEKLQMAHRYNLNNLKDHCLSQITTVADIRSVLDYDHSEMDPSVVAELLQKSLALHNK